MSKGRRLFTLFVLSLTLLGLDVGTKYLVDDYIPLMRMSRFSYPYGGIGICADFFGIECAITHATNTGAVAGAFSAYQVPLLIVRIIFISGLLFYLLLINQNRLKTLPLLLIIVGAIGNVVDFFIYGHVVDMVKFTFFGWHYPVFNVADSLIFIGIFWLVALSLFQRRPEKKEKDSPSAV